MDTAIQTFYFLSSFVAGEPHVCAHSLEGCEVQDISEQRHYLVVAQGVPIVACGRCTRFCAGIIRMRVSGWCALRECAQLSEVCTRVANGLERANVSERILRWLTRPHVKGHARRCGGAALRKGLVLIRSGPGEQGAVDSGLPPLVAVNRFVSSSGAKAQGQHRGQEKSAHLHVQVPNERAHRPWGMGRGREHVHLRSRWGMGPVGWYYTAAYLYL